MKIDHKLTRAIQGRHGDVGQASPYIQRQIADENEEAKMEQRERLLRFFAQNRDVEKAQKFFGFPSNRWIFERMLMEKFKDIRFVGVERL